MPIYKGNSQIIGIFKGTDEIVRRYKGSNLYYEAFTWEQYLYEFIYNSLVPTTINNKQVKNKARVNTIYANGVIENQLVDTITFYGGSNIASRSGSGTNELTVVSDGNGNLIATLKTIQQSLQNTTHKYLIKYYIETSVSGMTFKSYFISSYQNILPNTTNVFSVIATGSTINDLYLHNITISGNLQNGDTFKIKMNITDLTQMFGTGNEHTSLSDNRIQKILNSGYIPYNTGTYKGTDISEISSEQYNLFDGELESGTINLTNGSDTSSANAKRVSLDKSIKTYGGRTYTLFSTTTLRYAYFYEYDENKTFIKSTTLADGRDWNSSNITLNINTRFVRFVVTNMATDICLHLTGTRTGYAPHKTFTPIALKYQGNGSLDSHDTLEITSTEYVFTKNTFKITLSGSETVDNLTQLGTNFMGIANLFTSDKQPPHNYLPMFNKKVFNKGSISNLPEGYCYTYGKNFYYNK